LIYRSRSVHRARNIYIFFGALSTTSTAEVDTEEWEYVGNASEAGNDHLVGSGTGRIGNLSL
jgi:hypothetical protein